MKQTFERIYKSVLLEHLQNALPNRKVFVSNDLHYKPLENDPEGVVAIIQTGMGSKSAISGYDMNTVPVVVNFITQANNLQELLGALNSIASEQNGKYNSLSLNAEEYYYKAIYSTAYPIGAPFDIRIKSSVVRVMTINWTITLTYSHNAIIEPSVFKLKVGTTDYDINYIVRYEMSSQSNDEQTQYRENYLINYIPSSKTNVYTFVLLKVQSDEFQTLLRQEMIDINTILSTNEIKLLVDSETIDISNYSITEIFENNTSVFNLVLTR